MRNALILLTTCLFVLSCSSKQNIDREKYENLYKASYLLDDCSIDDPLQTLMEYQKGLKAECLIASWKVKTLADACFLHRIRNAEIDFTMAVVDIVSMHLMESYEREEDANYARRSASASWSTGQEKLKSAHEWFKNGCVDEESLIEFKNTSWPEWYGLD